MLFLLAFCGGLLTLLSPCLLPVLPFVLAGAGGQSWRRHGVPLLAGLALAFTAAASLGGVAADWAASAHGAGRALALALLAAVGLALLWPRAAAWLQRLAAALAGRVAPAGAARGPAGAFAIGVATGLLWAPCAGPVLGLVLGTAALQGPGVQTSALLGAYAAGAATALAGLLLVLRGAGRAAAPWLRRSAGIGEGLRRTTGAAVLGAVALLALGLDARLPGSLLRSTAPVEEALLRHAPAQPAPAALRPVAQPALPVLGAMQPLDGAVQWLNSPPLAADGLRGRVVLVDFWTHGCSNCLNALPAVKSWHAKYASQGLVVVGVHTPEFAYEKDIGNVRQALQRLGVQYPVAVDNRYAIWGAWGNRYWPAVYLVDAQGRVRFHHIGEGAYAETEDAIRQLLDEARRTAPRAS